MLFTFSLKLLLIDFVRSLVRADWYISFPNPRICIKLSHNYVIGPLYLYGSFSYNRYSNISTIEPQDKEISYHLKRVDDSCPYSILFTTLGKNLHKLIIEINLYLYKSDRRVAFILYTFYEGFKQGVYEMYDEYQHFALHTKVIDNPLNYLLPLNQSLYEAHSYVMSTSEKYSDICLVMDENNGVALTPNYESNENIGYITAFRAEIYRDRKLIGQRLYTAFNCIKDDEYSNNKIIFITDGENFDLDFFLIDHKSKMTRFKLPNQKYDYVYNLQRVNPEYKKVFLMKYKMDAVICSDESEVVVYLSQYIIKYYATVIKTFNISTSVSYTGYFYRSPWDLCGDYKNIFSRI